MRDTITAPKELSPQGQRIDADSRCHDVAVPDIGPSIRAQQGSEVPAAGSPRAVVTGVSHRQQSAVAQLLPSFDVEADRHVSEKQRTGVVE
jgi:hypothetical protein